jgi:hypothetical protein
MYVSTVLDDTLHGVLFYVQCGHGILLLRESLKISYALNY